MVSTKTGREIIVQITFESGNQKQTYCLFSKIGKTYFFTTVGGEKIAFDSAGKSVEDFKNWVEARLNNLTNSKTKLLKISELTPKNHYL